MLIQNIKLFDSYNFVSKLLSALTAIFGEEFPHLFNQPKYQNYCVQFLPRLEWYEPDSKSPKRKQELIQWYSEQVAQKVVFNCQEEMCWYCYLDVTVLCVCMDNIHTMFLNLKTLAGWNIGLNPFQCITIAAVGFDGIYPQYFLPLDEIMLDPQPGNDVYSNMQIAWLNKVMCKANITLNTQSWYW